MIDKSARAFSFRFRDKAGSLIALAGVVAMAGCAQAPNQQQARHGKEYFPESVYGHASARVVADGEPVPKGGGQYLVGNPYTVAGRTYVPSERKFAAVGLASWYGDAFHGRRTANGEIYDRDGITAAHPTMPLPSYARVTNLRNRRSIIVRVNDRGPYHANRVMDLSARAAEALDYKSIGTTKIKIEYIGRASLAGSDDRKLLATLRMDGDPAQLGDFAYSPTRLAEQREIQPSAAPDRESMRTALQSEPESTTPPPASRAEAVAPPRVAEAVAPPLPAQPPLPPEPPQRVALAEISGAAASLPKNPPLPPQRPFDLGANSGGDTPISVARR